MSTGRKLNQKFLENIDKQRDKILESGQIESQLSGNVIDVSGNNTAFIKEDDQDKYNAINNLKSYLEFNTFALEETYEIPGVTIKENNAQTRVKLYIRKEDIGKIAEEAEKFEALLGIELPAQIYQFKSKYKQININGELDDIPRPKLMSETPEQYEQYLSDFYNNHNIKPTQNPNGIGREPYPHEQIDFKINNSINENFHSEYYLDYIREEHLRILWPGQNRGQSQANNQPQRRNNRINDDDELTVRESDDLEKTPLGQKIGAGLTSFANFFKSGSNWQKIKTGAVGALLVSGAGFLVYSSPIAALVTGGAILGGVAIAKGIRKPINFLREKINSFLYGPKIEKDDDEPEIEQPTRQQTPPVPTPQPSTQEPQQPGRQSPQNPISTPEPTPAPVQSQKSVIPPEFDYYFEEAGINIEQYREIEKRIAVVNLSLQNLVPGTPEYQTTMIQLNNLKQQQKEQLLIMEELMEEMLKGIKDIKNGGKAI